LSPKKVFPNKTDKPANGKTYNANRSIQLIRDILQQAFQKIECKNQKKSLKNANFCLSLIKAKNLTTDIQ